jgi:hypothetical protein
MAEYIDKKYLDRKFQIDMMCTRGGTLFDTEKIINSLPTADVISIPEGATNGDMMKAMFPDAKVNNTKYSYVVEVKLPYHSKYDTGLLFDKDWWNAPYKRESEK